MRWRIAEYDSGWMVLRVREGGVWRAVGTFRTVEDAMDAIRAMAEAEPRIIREFTLPSGRGAMAGGTGAKDGPEGADLP